MYIRSSNVFAAFVFLAVTTLGKTLPRQNIVFSENKGQILELPDALYLTEDGSGMHLYFHKNKITYVINKKKKAGGIEKVETQNKQISEEKNENIIESYRYEVEFIGANQNVKLLAEGPAVSHRKYYLSSCPSGISTEDFSVLRYKNLYQGVDIIFKSNAYGRLEYDFVLQPGARLTDIKMRYTGVKKIETTGNTMSITTPLGELKEYIPSIYQTINKNKVELVGNYSIEKSSTSNQFDVSVQVSQYNPQYHLTIDPWINYYGGISPDGQHIIAIETFPNGDLATLGTSFENVIGTVGVYITQNVLKDSYICRYDSNGIFVWGTYYGGSNSELGSDITIDATENVAIIGETNSTDYPTYGSVFQTTKSGGYDAFIAKFDGFGNRLWATYCGGSYPLEEGSSIDADNAGNFLIGGSTWGNDLPVTPGAYQSINKGQADGFIGKIDGNGSLLWLTYLGGSSGEGDMVVRADGANNVIVVGTTLSVDFPTSTNAIQPNKNSNNDAFVTKFSPDGALQWSTFFGGNYLDHGVNVETDSQDNIVVLGDTESDDLPMLNSFQPFYAGGNIPVCCGDVFIIKLQPDGTLLWSTYFGGNQSEEPWGLGIDVNDNVCIWLDTHTDNLPIGTCNYNSLPSNIVYEQPFYATFSSSGQLICSTYLGTENDQSQIGQAFETGISKLAIHSPYVYLSASEINKPLPFDSVASSINFYGINNNPNQYIVQLCVNSCIVNPVANINVNNTNICVGVSLNFTSNVCDGLNSGDYKWFFEGGIPDSAFVANPTNITYPNPGTYDVGLVYSSPCGKDTLLLPNYISVFDSIIVTASNDVSICLGDLAALSASAVGGDNTPYVYTWSPNSPSEQIIFVSPSSSTNFSVTVTDATCKSNTDTVHVFVYTQPTASFNFSPQTTTILEPVISFTDSSTNNIITREWFLGSLPNTGVIIHDTLFEYTYSDTGTYIIKLIVTDVNGCRDTAIGSLRVNDFFAFYAPNTFTPNGDGLNDVFTIAISEVQSVKVNIFDRWGKLVKSWNTPNGFWDGKINGASAPQDAYVYSITYTKKEGHSEEVKGRVVLAR